MARMDLGLPWDEVCKHKPTSASTAPVLKPWPHHNMHTQRTAEAVVDLFLFEIQITSEEL